jgi:tRNA (guanine26-N2/guanine27-N2)-dimethyltransferase
VQVASSRFPLVEVTEGTTTFHVPKSEHAKGPKAKEGVPFYNPAMRLARDVSVLVARAEAAARKEPMTVCDAMASLGARGLRLANEVPNVHVTLNDPNLDAVHLAKQNAERLGLKNYDWRMGRLETLLSDHRFDWVDIDPFGTPAGFLDLAVAAVKDGGILAVTGTDKAALCGVYPEVCLRRYNARPLHNDLMWEVALRILLGAVARAAGRRDRWIEPVLAHSTQHYVRVYARIRDGADGSNRQASSYAYAWLEEDLTRRLNERPPPQGDYAGPLWAGPFCDAGRLDAILRDLPTWAATDLRRRLQLLREEAAAPALYYTIDEFTRSLKTSAPKMERLLERLRKEGFVATRTHFTPRGFKTDAPPSAVREALR